MTFPFQANAAAPFDFSRYRPPGVYTQSVPGPQLAVNSSAPTAVGIFGLSRGYKQFVESLLINPDATVTTVQRVTTAGSPSGGNFTLTFGAQTTGNIAYNASASTVQTAFTGLSSVGVGNAVVSGSAGGPWTITFQGTFADLDVALITADGSGLTGGTSPSVGVTVISTPTPAVNRTLAQQGILTDSVTVRNINSGAVYVLNTDYIVYRVSAGPDAQTGTRDDLYTVQRVVGGHILPGDTVQVQYNFTDTNYFLPQIFFDYDDVRDWYGAPFDSAGNIIAEITLACKFAFLNGAYQVVTVGVDPANPSSPTIGDYAAALQKMEDHPLVAIVVPCTGAQPIHAIVQEHVDAQSENKFERRAILARDGSVVPVVSSERQIDAQELTDQRIALVSPASFGYFSTELNQKVNLGGQYVAASLAGMTMAMSPAMPLTRKRLIGWTDVTEFMQEGAKNLETQNGLMVIEKSRRNLMQVRHGVTTDPTDLLVREWSIIGQGDALVFRLRDYLENDNLIGMPIYDITLINVKSSAEAALQSLIRDGFIRDYIGLKVRQLLTNPDVIEVTFGWLPAFPLNYILVRYAVTLSTGDVTATAGTQTTTDVTSASQVGQSVPNPADDFSDGNTLSSA